ncbi:hypothetical protein K491DRAFT_692748, partial [Lophiostoma macrostomum CBS 122681]
MNSPCDIWSTRSMIIVKNSDITDFFFVLFCILNALLLRSRILGHQVRHQRVFPGIFTAPFLPNSENVMLLKEV